MRSPRALIVSTGEERPAGESLTARLLLIEVGAGDIDRERLSGCQQDAALGLCAQATAGFIAWLASRLDQVRAAIDSAYPECRARAAQQALHHRTPGMVADLVIGWEQFLAFAQESGVLNIDEVAAHRSRVWQALGAVAAGQLANRCEANPVTRFLELVRAALATGHAYLARRDGGPPDEPGVWGWRTHPTTIGSQRRMHWRPQGARLGWLDGDDLYLDVDAAYRLVRRSTAGHQGLAVGAQTLVKRLHEAGLLKSTDQLRHKLKVRRVIEGGRREVLHLDVQLLQPALTEKLAQAALASVSG